MLTAERYQVRVCRSAEDYAGVHDFLDRFVSPVKIMNFPANRDDFKILAEMTTRQAGRVLFRI